MMRRDPCQQHLQFGPVYRNLSTLGSLPPVGLRKTGSDPRHSVLINLGVAGGSQAMDRRAFKARNFASAFGRGNDPGSEASGIL